VQNLFLDWMSIRVQDAKQLSIELYAAYHYAHKSELTLFKELKETAILNLTEEMLVLKFKQKCHNSK